MSALAQDLRKIKTFEQLLPYLEAELDWPLADYEFDDLTFEYAPEELGLKAEEAAKVKAIHQLRPLPGGQPWGIFFIEFERKKLPVVVLRRILSHLALKKRASANRADRVAFAAGDLLFISLFGEETSEQREIAFAHFHQAAGDLPTLRVLGWDGADTALKLDYVAATLQRRLRWPDDPQDAEAWREHWRGAFRHRLGHIIRTADALAETLAALARGIRDAALTLLRHESAQGPLQKLLKAFQTALIHDLTEEGFADTYAQTITYGLLTAAISRTEMSEGRHGTVLLAEDVADIVPVTNPFLKEMLQTFLTVGGRRGGIDFDELGIQDVVELLRSDETDLPAVLRDFGNRTQGEDPVIHFYEHFLSAYNKKLKVQRGVFYTPRPVVSYIVRSVHELLQTEFGLEDGLASTVTWGEMAQRNLNLFPPSIEGGWPEGPGGSVGAPANHPGANAPPLLEKEGKTLLSIPDGVSPDTPFVQILDPATGTATFLVEVIEVIHRTLTAKWKQQGLNEQQRLAAWNAYVPKHLLPRLYGYELMMAPYAIAHMKIGLKLYETGYQFQSEERVRVYLTNALEPASDVAKQQQFEELAPALAHEAQAVNQVKRNQRFTVVIGNPPYSNYGQLNRIRFILSLLDEYKRGLDEKKINIDDDFIKFTRFAHWSLAKTGVGCLGFITNNTYLDGVTHRQMRKSLMDDFETIRFVNLHGDSRKGEVCPDGGPDENVFDIQQGVAIGLFVRRDNSKSKSVSYQDVCGLRGDKYARLTGTKTGVQSWTLLKPEPPYYFAVPKDFSGDHEYETFVPLTEVLVEQNTGVQTKRDELFIDLDKQTLASRFQDIAKHSRDEAYLRHTYNLEDSSGWSVSRLAGLSFREQAIVRVLYRPFDIRWLYFDSRALGRARESTMRHMIAGKNIGLITLRLNGTGKDFVCLVTRHVIEKGSLPRGNYSLFPLQLYDDESNTQQFGLGGATRPNVGIAFLRRLEPHFLRKSLTPEDIFHYAYAVFHSPTYRTRYSEFLKIDFPRLPLTSSLDLFRALSQLGGELVALHLMESPKLDQHLTTYTGPAAPVVEKVSWANNTVWLDKAQKSGFRGVPENVWNFHIGGYQVCNKWLKDRKGRTLTADDINHYQRIVVALSETIRLMAEIDEVIDRHGGWPGAFVTESNMPEKI